MSAQEYQAFVGTLRSNAKVQVNKAALEKKQGLTFVFDRKTGDPVWPIEQRQVPKSPIPGERASPTQPFPTLPDEGSLP